MNNSYWDYLEHHGILGQKWGAQNGPPYPLSPSDYSAAERKLNKMRSKSDSLKKKAAKKQIKAGKASLRAAHRKAHVKLTVAAEAKNQRITRKLDMRAAKYTRQAGKKNLKALKIDKKIEKYVKQLELSKENVRLSDIMDDE